MKIKTKPKAIKLVAAVLSLLMINSVLPFFAVTASAESITPTTPQKDTGGVYQIGTEAELYWFADKVNNDYANYGNANAVLTADIVVNTGVLKADGTLNAGTFKSWTSIGNESNKYTGTFDGQGHTVSGLYFNDININTDFVGLFGCLGSGGEIKNVGVIDSHFYGYKSVGGVCGYNEGTITGCYNTGKVSCSSNSVGGVCGRNYNGTITGCYNTGKVSGDGEVGGVCGSNGGTITGCYNTGAVSGTDHVGGVCGYNYGTITDCNNTGTVSGTANLGGVCAENNGTITGCYNIGTVSGNDNVGGVCGYNNNNGKITGCYNIGTVSGDTRVGGVCGWNYGTITGCYNTGKVSSSNNSVGGVCGRNYNGKITGCYTNSGDVFGLNEGNVIDCEVKSDTEFKNGTVCTQLNNALKNANSDLRFYQGANYPKLCVIPKSVNGVYLIGTEAELYWFADKVNNDNANYGNASAVLTADIVVNTGVLKDNGTIADDTSGFTSWTPIGNSSNKYTGKFDGQGHTVSGLYFNNTNTINVGLFGFLGSGGEIKNVGVIDSYFNGAYYVGGVCGENYGTITGSYNTGTVSGSDGYVGGVCGTNDGTITGCYNSGTVSGSERVGGVCGLNNHGTITGCYNSGTVSGSGNKVGGVCGQHYYGTITDCYNTGTVSGKNEVGGVCGNNEQGKITGSYNTGTVSGSNYVGGVCGENYGPITGSYNTGTVSGTGSSSQYIGGVCGRNYNIITGCYTNNIDICGLTNGIVTDCAEHKDTEFANGTVCKLLNTALQNANSKVLFCQRIGADASPLLTYQFESIDEHTYEVYTVDNNTFKATCLCGQKTAKTMELTLKTDKAVVANGADNTLTATLSNYDNEAVTYKWYQDGVEIENATSSTYKMPKDLTTGTHTYRVDVTMANVGTITQSVDVLVDITPQYYVEIPASVNIGDSFTVSASNVLLKNNAQLKVNLLSDFTLSTTKGSLLNYEILNNSIKLNSGDTLLTVAGSENPTAPGSGTSDTYNVALAQGEKPKYSGNYTDTLTFTIKVEP